MQCNCLQRIVGTSRKKAAFRWPEHRADAQLITAQQQAQQRTHAGTPVPGSPGTGTMPAASEPGTTTDDVSDTVDGTDLFPASSDGTPPDAGVAGIVGLPDRTGRCAAANRRNNSTRNAFFKLLQVAGPALVLTGVDKRTTQSMAGKVDIRKTSRVTRLIVLRVTARGAKRFATTTPRRALANSFGRTYSTKCADRCTGRKRKADENSSAVTMRRVRAKSCVTGRLTQQAESGPKSGADEGAQTGAKSPPTYTAKRLRPLPRRALSTARPPRVAIRARKP